jgi:hypothetical protein
MAAVRNCTNFFHDHLVFFDKFAVFVKTPCMAMPVQFFTDFYKSFQNLIYFENSRQIKACINCCEISILIILDDS